MFSEDSFFETLPSVDLMFFDLKGGGVQNLQIRQTGHFALFVFVETFLTYVRFVILGVESVTENVNPLLRQSPHKLYLTNKEVLTVLCSVVKHTGSSRAQKKCWGKHELQSSVFPHFLSALPLFKCFTTEQSTIEASLLVL